MSRLPRVGSDDGDWGDLLNDFLLQEHNPDGTLKVRSDGTLTGGVSDAVVVHKAGAETITGAKNFTGGLSQNGQAVVVTNDGRLSDARIPSDLSVTDTKITAGGISASKVNGVEITAKKNVANGYAPLDGTAKVPVANLPAAALSASFPAVGELNWQPLTLINGWRDYGVANPGDSPEVWQSPRYAQVGSMVIVQGIIDGAGIGVTFPFAVLPPAVVPAKNRSVFLSGSNNLLIYVNGATSTAPGAIKPGSATAIPGYLLIDFTYFID